MKKKSRKILASAMSVLLTATMAFPSFADLGSVPEARTESDIRDFYAGHSFTITGSDTWSIAPDYSTATVGKLSDESVENGLNALNFVRYVAGIDANVEIKNDYEEKAQAATVLVDHLGSLTHHPSQPSDMPDDFFNLASDGCGATNLGGGYSSIAQNIINGWMDDSGPSNIDRVGHRRWCINPEMKYTGFGKTGMYTSMYSFDSAESSDYAYVLWPALETPVEYFKGPWCVTLNYYDFGTTATHVSDLKITMTDLGNGNEYEIDQNDMNPYGKYFSYDTQGYGMGPAIIFAPGEDFAAGDQVKVKIEGIKDKNGQDYPLEYIVHFFSINNSSSGSGTGSTGSGTESTGSGTGSTGSGTGSTGSDSTESTGSGSTGSGSTGSTGSGSSSSGSGSSSSGSGSSSSGSGSSSSGSGSSSSGSGSSSSGSGSSSSGSGSSSSGSGSSSSGGGSSSKGGSVSSFKVYTTTVTSVSSAKGWKQDNVGWWFVRDDGNYPWNQWMQIGNQWYYFDSLGYMTTGWRNVDNRWYYMNQSGAMVTGWVYNNNQWYYLNQDGSMAVGWINDNYNWYYLASSGAMLANTRTPGGYYVDGSGAWIQGR